MARQLMTNVSSAAAMLAAVWATVATPLVGRAADSQPVPRPYDNPVVRGYSPDPSVCRVDDHYYLAAGSGAAWPGVPIYHSHDLTHWQLVGHGVTTPGPLATAVNGGQPVLSVPTLRHHGEHFYLTGSDVSGGGNFVAVADDAFGPWSTPKLIDHGGADPSLFWDDDGTCHYTRRGDFAGVVDATLDPDAGRLLSPPRPLLRGTVGHDARGPRRFKRDGWYYLTCGLGSGRLPRATLVARSKTVDGSYEPGPADPMPGPVDLTADSSGHWWAVRSGTRPDAAIGPETFLSPVTWRDGWPVIAPPAAHVPAAPLPAEDVCPVPKPTDPFDRPTLGELWTLPWCPRGTPYSLTDRPGFLRLSPTADPVVVGRWQTEPAAVFTAAIEFATTAIAHEAGVVVYRSADDRFDLARTVRDGRPAVVLRDRAGESPPAFVPDGPLQLRITADAKRYAFAWSTDGTAWHDVGTARPTDDRRSGVLLGVYAAGAGRPPVDVDWCRYTTP